MNEDLNEAMDAMTGGPEREFDAMVETAFEDAARRLESRHTLLDTGAGRLEDRRYDVGGVKLAIGLRRRHNIIGLYADIGLPAPAAFRQLLEMNHACPPGGMRLGMHPRSRRLVATVQLPIPGLHLQPELIEDVARDLARHAHELRISFRE
ncbi:MAG: hypothetical protein V4757_16780 [Pseudomonadota bacterium]